MRKTETPAPEDLKLGAHIAQARVSLLAYATLIDRNYQLPPHIRLLAKYLEDVETGAIKKLIITMPPRHGKSELISGKFPGWFIGRDPTRKVILTSYGATLANIFSTQVRDTIDNNPMWKFVFPTVSLDPNKQSQDLWAVDGQRESFIAAGIQGVATGFGAHLLIIDDPLKNYAEAASESTRELIWNTYLTVSKTRLEPDGRIIIVATRWHKDDLIGRIMASEDADDWTVLHLPALSLGNKEDYEVADERTRQMYPTEAFPDPLNRPKGKALWSRRWSRKFLEKARRVLQHHFSALYQGMPTDAAGGKLQGHWFRPITPSQIKTMGLNPLKRARSWDLAWSARTSADQTAGIKGTLYLRPDPKEGEEDKFSEYPRVLLVLEDIKSWRKEWDDSGPDIIKASLEDGSAYHLLIEAVASQSVGFKSLRRSPRLRNRVIFPVKPDGDKETRGKMTTTLASTGVIYLLYPQEGQPPDWEEGFLEEITNFPNARHDDMYDALTQMVNFWADEILLNLYKDDSFIWQTMGGPLQPSTTKKQRNLPFEFQDSQPVQKVDRLGWFG